MSIKLRRKTDGLIVEYDAISCNPNKVIYDSQLQFMLPKFMREQYDIVPPKLAYDSKIPRVLVPPCGWEKLTLDNFEEQMGRRFVIDKEQSMRGISREVAFLELLESKGVNRKTRLIEGLTLENFEEKVGHRFRMRKEDKARGLSRQRAFEEWLKINGYK